MPTIEEMRAELKKSPQPSIEEMRAALKEEPPKEPTGWDVAKDLGKTGLEVLKGALTYPAGVARTVGSYPFSPNVSGQDVLSALKGKAPSGNQILGTKDQRMSEIQPELYGEGLTQFKKGGIWDPTNRPGALLEVPLDPLTYLGAKPVGNTLKKAGEAQYKSGFKIPDFVAKEEGAAPLSSFFMKGKPIMSAGDIAVANAKLGKEGISGMRSVIKDAETIAPPVSQEAALGNALSKAQEIKKNPFTASAGKNLEQQVLDYWGKGNDIPLAEAYKMSKESGKQANWAGRAADLPKSEVLQQARHGLEGEVINSLEQASPDLANKYMQSKQAARTSIVTEPYLKREIGKAIRKNNITEVKGALAGRALESPALRGHGLLPLAMMYASKVYNTPLGRTATGRTLYDIGTEFPVDALIRQKLINQSPWQEIKQKESK